jgi:hypothetical protein
MDGIPGIDRHVSATVAGRLVDEPLLRRRAATVPVP